MFCSNCGKEISDAAYVCPYCGVRTPLAMAEQQQQHYTDESGNGFAIAGLICAFFIPLLGLIFSCVGLSRSKQMNGTGRGMSIAGIVISVLEMAIVVIIVIAVIAMTAAAASSMGAVALPLA